MDKSTSGGLRILILEDDENLLRALTRRLRIEGHHITGVTTVAEALREPRRPDAKVVIDKRGGAGLLEEGEPFDLALLDLELPDGIGTEVATELLSTGGALHIIFFSGTLDKALRTEAEAIAQVFHKSDLDALVEAIRTGALSAENGAAGAGVLGLAPDSDSDDD